MIAAGEELVGPDVDVLYLREVALELEHARGERAVGGGVALERRVAAHHDARVRIGHAHAAAVAGRQVASHLERLAVDVERAGAGARHHQVVGDERGGYQ